MRYLIVCMLILAACQKPISETSSLQASFVPSQCSFSRVLTNDPMFTGSGITDPVSEYTCALYDKMTCTAYAIDGEYLGLNCEVINPAQPQGVPDGCTYIPPATSNTPMHGFLDGSILDVEAYNCGTLNGNMHCSYYKSTVLPFHEEIRCHLL